MFWERQFSFTIPVNLAPKSSHPSFNSPKWDLPPAILFSMDITKMNPAFFLMHCFNERNDWRVAWSTTQKCFYSCVHVHEASQTLPSHCDQWRRQNILKSSTARESDIISYFLYWIQSSWIKFLCCCSGCGCTGMDTASKLCLWFPSRQFLELHCNCRLLAEDRNKRDLGYNAP